MGNALQVVQRSAPAYLHGKIVVKADWCWLTAGQRRKVSLAGHVQGKEDGCGWPESGCLRPISLWRLWLWRPRLAESVGLWLLELRAGQVLKSVTGDRPNVGRSRLPLGKSAAAWPQVVAREPPVDPLVPLHVGGPGGLAGRLKKRGSIR